MIGPGHFRFPWSRDNHPQPQSSALFVHAASKTVETATPKGIELARIGIHAADTTSDTPGVLPRRRRRPTAHRGAPGAAVRPILLELERLSTTTITEHRRRCATRRPVQSQTPTPNASANNAAPRRARHRHRLMRGAIYPGGHHRRATRSRTTGAIGSGHRRDRRVGAGQPRRARPVHRHAILTRTQAADLGTLGYVARASGLATDARHDHPTLPPPCPHPYNHTDGTCCPASPPAPTHHTSITLITYHLNDWATPQPRRIRRPGQPAQPRRSARAGPVGGRHRRGLAGTITHRVELAADHTLTRSRSSTPASSTARPAVALADTIVPTSP